ncbi:hypothetical protein OIDMADRAFT_60802 [Oidiodendron maius Zn]|uniref:Uncharacterized protein n=1 Tax=Oidiodendron maius (strain Zn) TaxID=913774 RepID=A0A0C3GEA1_OIDMZ|nr:hypothetical protein OIDMADRAFT_60802 [Oidiodendron maius Zn]
MESPWRIGHDANNNTAREASDELSDLDHQMATLFTDLNEFDEARAQQQRILEQLPEMRRYRSTQRNVLKVDKVMDWVESTTSQLLWIDGNNILQRETFSALFVAPLLIFGEDSFETYLVLRHFCGDSQSVKPSNYRTLIQALLVQIFKQRSDIWGTISSHFTKESAGNIRLLWNFFAKCLKVARAQCTFIIIDSIDFLVSESTEDGISEKEFVMKELNALVNESNSLIKILLTASLSQGTQSAHTTNSSTLASLSYTAQCQSQGKLSMAIIQDHLTLVSHKLVEIQEKRCNTIQFAQLPMIYSVNSTIYTRDDGSLRAFVVSELSGMDPRPFGAYSPLVIRAWAIGHNGKDFIKRFYDLNIQQFAGEVKVVELKYIPAGYLQDEHLQRPQLIERGRRYWELGSEVCLMGFKTADSLWHIIIDQRLQPIEARPLQELDVELSPVLHSHLKPLAAITCPPRIPAYCLHDNVWSELDVVNIQEPDFQYLPFGEPYLRQIEMLRTVIGPYKEKHYMPSNPTLVFLHGVPGAGKATAARYSAKYTRRPLLSILSADIIKYGGKVEETFTQLLNRAERWRAILLVKNVELMFRGTSRETLDLGLNRMLLIKALETHRGLVFLTTNRINLIDVNVFSRITVSIEFPSLNDVEKWGILTNLAEHYGLKRDNTWHKLSVKHLNGWEIQDAFITALNSSDGDSILWWEHFSSLIESKLILRRTTDSLYEIEERKMRSS